MRTAAPARSTCLDPGEVRARLPAGELAGPVPGPVRQPHLGERGAGLGGHRPPAREAKRKGDVLLRRERRDQVERLKGEADPLTAEQREAGLAERAQVDALDDDGSLRGPVEPGRTVQQGGLTQLWVMTFLSHKMEEEVKPRRGECEMTTKSQTPKTGTEQQARITLIKAAMRDGGAMSINGVDGRWNLAGDTWTADEMPRNSTLILVRISDAEEEEINGVARQVEDTCTLTDRRGARVGMILVENDTSAFKRRKIQLPNGEYQLRTVRPQFRRALKLLSEKLFRRFTTYHLDRTVRDPRDLEDLIDVIEGSRPRIIADSFTGSLRLSNDSDITAARILCAVANQASRDTVRRVSRARKQQAEEGRYGGGRRAYGFEPDGITLRPQEADIIEHYHAVALAGVSLKEIARDMKRAGILTVDGRPFQASQVRALLLRPRNAGLTVHRPVNPDIYKVPQNDHEVSEDEEAGDDAETPATRHYTPDDVVGRLPGTPIIDPEDHWALVRKLTDPDRQTNHVGNTPVLLGSCIYNCPCGDKLRAQNKKWNRKDRATGEVIRIDEQRTYRCVTTGPGHVLCPAQELDALVAATIKELIRISDPADIIGHSTADGIDIPALRAELATHQERLEQISADYDDDLITRSQMLASTAKRRKKIEEVKAKLEQVSDNINPATKLIGVPDIDAAWDALSLGEQREICRRMVTVTVHPVGRGRRVPIRERVTISKPKRDAQTTTH